MKKIYLPWLLLGVLLSGCSHTPEVQQHTILAFGTIIDITLYDVDAQKAEIIFNKLEDDYKTMHAAWSPWVDGSLMRMNKLIATGAEFSAAPSVLPLIKLSIPLEQKTNHLFDPAINRLIRLWEFHRHDDPDIHPPDDKLIQEIVAKQPRLTDLHIDGVRMRSDNPDVELNFGAVAKGYAIDLNIEYLKSMGVKNAVINAGGDLKSIGTHGDRPWRIGIRDPRKDGVIASIETHGEEAVFTSGDYERFYFYKGKRYHHILDPRTGYPAQGSESVTVIHRDSAMADAAATALFVAGPDQWYEIAKNLGLHDVMLIDSKGQIHITPSMRKRIELMVPEDTVIIESPPL